MRRPELVLLLLASCAVAPGALAHHSASAFDRTRPIVVSGTVARFQWANPHVWISLDVPDGRGGAQRWELEGPPMSMMARSGWTGRTVKPGDRLRILIAPYRDGSRRGEFMVVRGASGKTLAF